MRQLRFEFLHAPRTPVWRQDARQDRLKEVAVLRLLLLLLARRSRCRRHRSAAAGCAAMQLGLLVAQALRCSQQRCNPRAQRLA